MNSNPLCTEAGLRAHTIRTAADGWTVSWPVKTGRWAAGTPRATASLSLRAVRLVGRKLEP